MKTISPALEAHLALETTTVCTCWKITRTDGQVFAFTDLDQPVVLPAVGGDVTYQPNYGFERTAIASAAGFAVDNLDVIGILDNEAITEADMRLGLFDYAKIEIDLVNWSEPSSGAMRLRTGWIGEVVVTPQGRYQAELRGLSEGINHNFGNLYSNICRTDLGTTKCGIPITSSEWTRLGTVASVVDFDPRRAFVLEAAPEFDLTGGWLRFLTGANAGRSMEIDFGQTEAISLLFRFPAPIAVGDTLEYRPGCDKTTGAGGCAKFNNIINFRGEPFIPGIDEALAIPNST